MLAVLKLQTAKPNLETQPLGPQTTFSNGLGVTIKILLWAKMDHIKLRETTVYYWCMCDAYHASNLLGPTVKGTSHFHQKGRVVTVRCHYPKEVLRGWEGCSSKS